MVNFSSRLMESSCDNFKLNISYLGSNVGSIPTVAIVSE